MKLNRRTLRRIRLGVYLASGLGTPVVVYLRARGIIGDLELTLWGAEIAGVMALAGLNVKNREPHWADAWDEGLGD